VVYRIAADAVVVVVWQILLTIRAPPAIVGAIVP
jgi:hypothetical protein